MMCITVCMLCKAVAYSIMCLLSIFEWKYFSNAVEEYRWDRAAPVFCIVGIYKIWSYDKLFLCNCIVSCEYNVVIWFVYGKFKLTKLWHILSESECGKYGIVNMCKWIKHIGDNPVTVTWNKFNKFIYACLT